MRKTDFIWICMAAESLGSSSWELERAKRDWFPGKTGEGLPCRHISAPAILLFFLNCAVRIHVIYRNTVTANLCESIYMKCHIMNMYVIERFSIECCKTKTKVITPANQNKEKYHKEPMRTQSKYT